MIEQQDLSVTTLGECQYSSPLNLDSASHAGADFFVSESERIRLDATLRAAPDRTEPLSLEEAGPRQRIFFEPRRTTAARSTLVVTQVLAMSFSRWMSRMIQVQNGASSS